MPNLHKKIYILTSLTLSDYFIWQTRAKTLNRTGKMSQSKVLHLYRVSLLIKDGGHNTAKKKLPNIEKRTDKTVRH